MRRLIAILALAALTAACGQKTSTIGAASPAGESQLSGAGATFPAPLYQQWAEGYRQASGVRVSYQGIGSGGGIKQIKAGTIDFGGTDKPLPADELDKAGLLQFPAVLGGVSPVVNVPGIAANQLTLSGPELADIYAGVIKLWDDPRLVADNPGVKLPHLPISVVHRSDGSGTTFLFTSYLALVSPSWKASPGASDSVAWPVGIGGKGNDGVSAFVRQTIGSIGYVEYAYATRNSLAAVKMRNHAGQVIAPSAAAFAAAAAGADWKNAPGFHLLLLDQPDPAAWPIAGATFILVRKDATADQHRAVAKFFDWAFTNGDAAAGKLDYVPLPAPVKALVRASWASEGLSLQ